MTIPPKKFHLKCEEPWFSLIRQGVKPVEGRKNSPKHSTIQKADFIEFSNGSESFLTIVTDIKQYPTLDEYLHGVTIQKALPGVASFEEAKRVYLKWSTPEEIESYGFLAIFVKVVPVTSPSR